VAAGRYLDLARRESELARSARERSEAAERFALRQVDEGLRDHFLRLAGRAEMESEAHAARARRFHAVASKRRATSAAAAERGVSQATAEVVKHALAACLRDDFEVALEHIPERISPAPAP
jgi:hypothetical protein